MANELSRPSGPASATNAVALPARPAMALMDVPQFEQMQRIGRMLALSSLFPEHLRKGGNDIALANGVLVVNMALRLQEDPLTVAQNIYFVNGRPGWNTTYMISKANMHGVFKNPIDWNVTGEGDSLVVEAFAELTGTGKRVSMTASMKMAKAEGWTNNNKYQSMPEVMLRYRSAASLIRMYCPEVMIGIPPSIEIETEMRDVSPTYAEETVARIEAAEKPKAAKAIENVDPETGEVTTEGDAAPVARRPRKTAAQRAEEEAAAQETARLKQQEDQRRADDEERQRMQAERDAKAKADKEAADAKAKADEEAAKKAAVPQAADMDAVVGDTGQTLGQMLQRLQDHAEADLDDGAGLQDTLDMYAARFKAIAAVSQEEHDALVADLSVYAEQAEKNRKGRS